MISHLVLHSSIRYDTSRPWDGSSGKIKPINTYFFPSRFLVEAWSSSKRGGFLRKVRRCPSRSTLKPSVLTFSGRCSRAQPGEAAAPLLFSSPQSTYPYTKLWRCVARFLLHDLRWLQQAAGRVCLIYHRRGRVYTPLTKVHHRDSATKIIRGSSGATGPTHLRLAG